MKANSRMDEWVRARLENLEVKYDPATWELLALRMDAATPSFDEAIADKLGNVEVNTSAASWEAMEKRLDIEEAAETIENEAALDEVIYEKLHNYSVPLRESHWKRMAQRLESEFVLRKRILQQKTAELVLMALLLMTLIRFEPLLLQNTRAFAGRHHPVTELTKAQEASTDDDKAQPSSDAATTSQDFTGSVPPGSHHSSVQDNRSSSTAIANKERHQTELNTPTPLPYRAMKEWATQPEANELSVNPAGVFNTENFDLLSNDFENVESRTTSALILPSVKKLPAPIEVRFSLLSTVDYNIVATPADRFEFQGTQIRTDDDTTAASGYGGGILVDFKSKRWAFQTGGIYSFKRYIPNTPALLFQTVDYYVKEDFHGIQQDIFQIPLTLNYYFKNTGNWRMYGGIGIAGHFITSSVYEFRYTYTPTFNLVPPNPPAEGSTPSLKEEKNFPKGLLDGGRLSENLYLTANLSLGIERYLSGRTSIFLQPNYQHYLLEKGIGTNKDKLYTFSLFLGARVGLK